MELTSNKNNIMDFIFIKLWNYYHKNEQAITSSFEPTNKKMKLDLPSITTSSTFTQTDNDEISEYLSTINRSLNCIVCKELQTEILQCKNGHLICSNCFSQILQKCSNRCPICRVNLDRNFTHSLIAEQLINDMPQRCVSCAELFPTCLIESHRLNDCLNRVTKCKYSIVGCDYIDKCTDTKHHESICSYKDLKLENSIENILDAFLTIKKDNQSLNNIFNELSNKCKCDASLNLNVKDICLVFSKIENNIMTFKNNPNKQFLKVKLNIDLNNDIPKLSYSLCSNGVINGKYSFFIHKIKINNKTFNINDHMHTYTFADLKNWTSLYEFFINKDNNDLNEAFKNIEKCTFRMCLFLINNVENIQTNELLQSRDVAIHSNWYSLIRNLGFNRRRADLVNNSVERNRNTVSEVPPDTQEESLDQMTQS